MAENKNDDVMANLEDTYTKLEKYVMDNRQQVFIITGVIVAIILIYFGFTKYYIPKQEDKAQSQIFMAQKYFSKDSLNAALNGGDGYPGFLKIINEYKWTKAANLACYYVGNIYLRQGKYNDAIAYLKKFSSSDKMISALALGQTGDAYSELGKYDDAENYYKKAAYYVDNDVISPMYLEKEAELLRYEKKYSEAKQAFEELKQKYPHSQQAMDADKYITELSLMN